MPQQRKKLSIDVPANLEARIASLAEQTGRSQTVIVGDAIDTYVNAQLRWLGEMNAAITDAKHGQFFDGGDVLDWLDSWGSNAETSRPGPLNI